MPDGSQQPPVDPAAERAQEQMRQWREQHRDPDGGAWRTSIGATVGDFMAAANAGALAVSPDTGAAIIKQLTDVQDRVAEMRSSSTGATTGTRLGGGYAEQVSTFNQQVNEEGPQLLMAKFADELEQLKAAVAKSVQNYQGSDSAGRRNIDAAGGGQE
jgi:hypothetical protein